LHQSPGFWVVNTNQCSTKDANFKTIRAWSCCNVTSLKNTSHYLHKTMYITCTYSFIVEQCVFAINKIRNLYIHTSFVTSSKSLRLVVSEETNFKVSVNKKKELHIAAMISATSKWNEKSAFVPRFSLKIRQSKNKNCKLPAFFQNTKNKWGILVEDFT
jgi:hypothetical protein